MKYGEEIQREPRQWAIYNLDYNELKKLIKLHTKKDEGAAITIPGQADAALRDFEEQFFIELRNQHDRVDLFVKSKSFEINSRLKQVEKQVMALLRTATWQNGTSLTFAQRNKFGKYDRKITSCIEDTKSLQRFVNVQRTAFRKILKKYRKWTGSPTLGERFNEEVLGSPKSFTKQYGDFEDVLSREKEILALLRNGTPDASVPTTPQVASRRPSAQLPIEYTPQSYWNEYDDGSEAGGDEPYIIYVDPNADSEYPGARTIATIFSSLGKLKGWLSPSLPDERRPLLRSRNGDVENGNEGQFTDPIDTDADEEAYASSTEYPTNGFVAHYSTFPSVDEQRFSRSREKLLFRGTVSAFAVSFVLILIAGVLISTGKHKLLAEVDVGALVGIFTSLFFAALGLGLTAHRTGKLSWLYRSCVGVTFIAACVLNGMLLVMVMGNGGL